MLGVLVFTVADVGTVVLYVLVSACDIAFSMNFPICSYMVL